jgi:hypothetical protein
MPAPLQSHKRVIWKIADSAITSPDMSGCPLPVWIEWLQALAVPVIACVGAWIALQQMRLARVKLQHDTYDRKHTVFVAVRSLLTVVAGLKRAPSLEDMRAFIIEAMFHFQSPLAIGMMAAFLRAMEPVGNVRD